MYRTNWNSTNESLILGYAQLGISIKSIFKKISRLFNLLTVFSANFIQKFLKFVHRIADRKIFFSKVCFLKTNQVPKTNEPIYWIYLLSTEVSFYCLERIVILNIFVIKVVTTRSNVSHFKRRYLRWVEYYVKM